MRTAVGMHVKCGDPDPQAHNYSSQDILFPEIKAAFQQ